MGHIARDCPTAAAGGAPAAPKTCRNCKGSGPIAKDCTAATRCRECGSLDHLAAACLAGTGDSRVCRGCNQSGHIQKDCPSGAAPKGGKGGKGGKRGGLVAPDVDLDAAMAQYMAGGAKAMAE